MNPEEKNLIDLEALFNANEYEHLIEYARTEQADLYENFFSENFIQLQKETRYNAGMLRFLLPELQQSTRDYTLFMLGSLQGAVHLIGEILLEYNQDKWIENQYIKEMQIVTHLPEIISALETHGSMTHREMSDSLGMNPSTLTEAMKKVIGTGLIHVSSVGKYKLYALTDTGRKVGRLLRKEVNLTETADQKAQRLLEEFRITMTQCTDLGMRTHIKRLIQTAIEPEDGVLIYKNTRLKLRLQNEVKIAQEEYVVDEIPRIPPLNDEVTLDAHKVQTVQMIFHQNIGNNHISYSLV